MEAAQEQAQRRAGEQATGLIVLPPNAVATHEADGGRRTGGGWGRGAVGALLAAALALGAGGMALGVTALVRSSASSLGPAGPAGPRGAQGLQGLQGVQGLVGPQGPAGPAGQRGATGLQGPAGSQGARGPTGKAGAAGTIAASTIVAAPLVKSQADPALGTTLTAEASCPSGQVVLGGGGRVSTAAPKTATSAAGRATGTDGRATSAGTSSKGARSTATSASSAAAGKHPAGVELESSYPVTGGWRALATVTGSVTGGQEMTLQSYVLCGKK